ncbi:MAG: M1 family aminopeptidase [Candidatus Acidiferrum sp.]
MIEPSHRMAVPGRKNRLSLRAAVILFALLLFSLRARPDEPYARTRDYDLQHSRIALRFDIDQRKVLGDVTHEISMLRDNTPKISFDAVGLTVHSVVVNKSPAKFETNATRLIVSLPGTPHTGDTFQIEILYEGKPTKGLYFILPDKDYPTRPIQIWTQGESEDTRFYLPTYDYPNDRLTTETILTVPAEWVTVANGKLISVIDAGNTQKTWTWRESQPSSTYLITVVAGEFDEVKQSLRGLPLTYYAPKGRGDRLLPNYERTPAMIELFNKKLAVEYPWEKYAQVMVDDFVAGGMENSSATTNTSDSLRSPKLIPEYPTNEDALISHELAHQWFGDLVTCKDWSNIWLNEGFATFFETVWSESHYPKDQAKYDTWKTAREWFMKSDLYEKPIVRRDFEESEEFDGNAYEKAGWVLYMLRHQLGDDAFWRSLKHYLDANRGKNVVTPDLVKAIEETTHVNVDRFFQQWIYGAGAPKFDLSYAYDAEKHQIALNVKQVQKGEGRVGTFDVPVDIEITTASGPKLYPIRVTKATETFSFPSESAPLMVLFDKGGYLLKSANFHKEKKEWLYQLKNAAEFADRADAVVALGKIKDDDQVVAALAGALNSDPAWGVRATSAEALGRLGGASALKNLTMSLDTNSEPAVRFHIVSAIGYFKDNPDTPARLEAIARDDRSYRARASALEALGHSKTPNALLALTAAVNADSPDGILRNAALRSLGFLGDDKAVPLLRAWAAPGKALDSRASAIASLGRLDKDNKEITQQIASYLTEPHFSARWSAIHALGNRGDASAVPALEALLKSNDLSIEMVPEIKEQIDRLQQSKNAKAKSPHAGQSASADGDSDGSNSGEANSANASGINNRLDHLEQLIEQLSQQLKSMESRLPAQPKN